MGAEGGADDEVVVDELAGGGVSCAVGDGPAHGAVGAGEDFGLGEGALVPEGGLEVVAGEEIASHNPLAMTVNRIINSYYSLRLCG